jgi:hypothetical protein
MYLSIVSQLAKSEFPAFVLQYLGNVGTDVHPEFETNPSGPTMKALAWFGNQDVRIVNAPIPEITEPDDVILKVTASTICGSDLHLCVQEHCLSLPLQLNFYLSFRYHGEIMAMQKGDILGHEVKVPASTGYTFVDHYSL